MNQKLLLAEDILLFYTWLCIAPRSRYLLWKEPTGLKKKKNIYKPQLTQQQKWGTFAASAEFQSSIISESKKKQIW